MDLNHQLSLYATLGEVVEDDDRACGRTHKTATIETTDEGRLTVDELLAGKR